MEGKEIQSIGSLLRSLRENKGLLLRELGAKLSLDPTLLSKIERGERLPTKEQIKAFTKTYRGQKETIMVAWLSDVLVHKVKDEKLAIQAMQVAESKLKYGYE